VNRWQVHDSLARCDRGTGVVRWNNSAVNLILDKFEKPTKVNRLKIKVVKCTTARAAIREGRFGATEKATGEDAQYSD